MSQGLKPMLIPHLLCRDYKVPAYLKTEFFSILFSPHFRRG